MNNNVQKIRSWFARGSMAAFFVTIVPGLAVTALAQPVPVTGHLRSAASDLTRSASPSLRFFDAGRAQLESEIWMLSEDQLATSVVELEVSEDLQPQNWLYPLESPGTLSKPRLELEVDVVPSQE